MATENFDLGSLTNVTLRYQNEDAELAEIKCHSAVLSCRSPHFKTMLEESRFVQVYFLRPLLDSRTLLTLMAGVLVRWSHRYRSRQEPTIRREPHPGRS